MLQNRTAEGLHRNTNKSLDCKRLHISASVRLFQPQSQWAPQKLRFYSSVSQKRPQSATQGSLVQHQLLSPLLSSTVCRGTPPNIYPVNTHSLVPFLPLFFFAFGKKSFCERLSEKATNGAISLCWEHLRRIVFSKMTSLCLSHLFVLLSSSSHFSFPLSHLSVPLQWTCGRTSLVHRCQKCVSVFSLFYFSCVFRCLFPVRYLSLTCHARCLLLFSSAVCNKMPRKANINTLSDSVCCQMSQQLFQMSDSCCSKLIRTLHTEASLTKKEKKNCTFSKISAYFCNHWGENFKSSTDRVAVIHANARFLFFIPLQVVWHSACVQ